MAKILKSETSLLRRQEAIGRELAARRLVRAAVWTAAAAVLAWGVWALCLEGTYVRLVLGGLAAVCAIGYELRLREIAGEARNIEGGRRGEAKMAAILAEQLADDHLILNDLELRIAHERGQIDHLVLAPSGIYVLESKYWSGTLSGDVHDTQWRQRKHGFTRLVKSPVLQCERQRRMLISMLETRVPEDRIHALAVFTHPAAELRISGGTGHAVNTRDAVRFINDRCFDAPVLDAAGIQALADEILRRL